MTTEVFDTPALHGPRESLRPIAPVREAPPTGPIAHMELLARDPTAFADMLEHAEKLSDNSDALVSLARTLVGTLVVGAATFGAVIGAHRGGLQVLWCTLKIPLVLLVTLVVCAPPFVALARAARLPVTARGIIALTLASCTRFALVLAGLAPFVWLMEGWSMGYHRVILAVVAVCTIAGIAGARVLSGALSRAGAAGPRVGLALAVVFALVGAQTSWILRPYVVRPRTEHIPFVRALEGDFFASVFTSSRSAVDVYSAESERRAAERRARGCDGGTSCD